MTTKSYVSFDGITVLVGVDWVSKSGGKKGVSKEDAKKNRKKKKTGDDDIISKLAQNLAKTYLGIPVDMILMMRMQ